MILQFYAITLIGFSKFIDTSEIFLEKRPSSALFEKRVL